MDLSPGNDRMEWSPSRSTTVLYQSQEPWNGSVAGQRRTFEQFSDGSEPRGRQSGTIAPIHVQRHAPGQPRYNAPPDQNLSAIPEVARRVGVHAVTTGLFILGQLGKGVGYAGVAIKRRLFGEPGTQPADSSRQYGTPRRRRRRNMYLTPRQMYERRSLRSIRVRDMPGRFPGVALSFYSNADPHEVDGELMVLSSAEYCPEVQDYIFGGPVDESGSPQLDSPLLFEEEKAVSAIKNDDHLAQEVELPLPGASQPPLDDSNTSLITTLDDQPPLDDSNTPLITTLDEDLDQENKKKEALESTAAHSLEALLPTPALSFDSGDSSDSSDSDEQLTDLDTAPTSPDSAVDNSLQLQEEFEPGTLKANPYDPNDDPTLAIVPEAQGDWEMNPFNDEETVFVPMFPRHRLQPTTEEMAARILRRSLFESRYNKDSPAKTTIPTTEAVQDPIEAPLIASNKKEVGEQENKSDDFAAKKDVERSSSPSATILTAAPTKEPLASAPETTVEGNEASGTRDEVDESAACNTESSDNSRSSMLAASISPQQSVSSPPHPNGATQQQTANQSQVAPTGNAPNFTSLLAHLFGYRRPPPPPETPTTRPQYATPRVRKTVGFYESPKTGRPVTKTKRFVIGESIDHPSPSSSRDESSLLSDNTSPPGQEAGTAGADQIALNSQLQAFQPSVSSEPGSISPALGEVSYDSTETLGKNAEESCNQDIEMPDAPIENSEKDTQLIEETSDHVTEENQSQVENTDTEAAGHHPDGNHNEAQDGASEKEGDRLGEDEGNGNDGQDGASEKEEDHPGDDEGNGNQAQDGASEKEEDRLGEDEGNANEGQDGASEKEDDHLGNDEGNGNTQSRQDQVSTDSNVPADQDVSMRESEDMSSPQDANTAGDDNHQGESSEEINGQPTTPRTQPRLARKGGKKMKRKDLSGALDDLSINQEINVSPRRVSARRQSLAEKEAQEKAAKEKREAEEKAQREKEEAERRAQQEREAEEQRIKLGGRQYTKEPVIQPLPAEWNRKVDEAMSRGSTAHIATTSGGNTISRREMGMVLPQRGDDPSGWLNDEIIAGYLQAVVDYGNTRFNLKRGDTPKLQAFNSFFYTNLKKPGGYQNVKRWARRAKVGGKDLLKVEWIFIPVNVGGNHWTLAVVSPVRKTIEYFDSMHGSATQILNNVRGWLAGELEDDYVADEWVVRDDDEGRYVGRGKGPTQNNGSDCGVFTVTTAKLISLGIEPLAFSARDTLLQRRRIVAELMNGGFNGEFVPQFEFASFG